jgi:hypothetical protein
MVKRGWEVRGYSLSGLEMRWAAIWTVTQVNWQLWITPRRAMDGFSCKDRWDKSSGETEFHARQNMPQVRAWGNGWDNRNFRLDFALLQKEPLFNRLLGKTLEFLDRDVSE